MLNAWLLRGEFREGNVVRDEYGTLMVVVSIEGDTAICEWFDEYDVVRCEFYLDELRRVRGQGQGPGKTFQP